MAYFPFIYFTLLLFFCIYRTKRFGISAAAIAWVDLSAFCSILVDQTDTYDEWGVLPNSLYWGGVLTYCLLWTIVFIPLMRLDSMKISRFTISKPYLFRYLCYFLIICIFIYFFSPEILSNIKERITLKASDAYDLLREQSYEVKESKGMFWLWIPMIVTNAWALVLLCWFISLTICRQSRLLSFILLVSSAALMFINFISGGRGTLIWWAYTFFAYFCFFSPLMEKKIKRTIAIIGIGAIAIIGIGVMYITISRFDSGFQDTIYKSLIGYAGEQLNNFCGALQVVPAWDNYTKQLFPLSHLLLEHKSFDANDYITHLSETYNLEQTNLFFTFFMRIAFDVGIIGMAIFLILYLLMFHFMAMPQNRTYDFSRLIMLSLLMNIPIRGLFNYPFVTHVQTLYILLSVFLFLLFYQPIKRL